MKLKQVFEQEMETVLALVKADLFPKEFAVIAGGCLRDHLNGKPTKDIDVFVRTDVSLNEYVARLRMGSFPNARLQHGLSYSDNNDVTGVIDTGAAMPSGPIQIILLKRGETPVDAVDRIDLGLCQVGFDMWGLYCTDAFLRDCVANTMTVVNCASPGAAERTQRRFDRLSEKYEGFKFVAPLNFAPFFNSAPFFDFA